MDITLASSLHMTRLSKILKNIFSENENLSVFMNNIYIGKIYSNGHFNQIYKIKFLTDINEPRISSDVRTIYDSASIRIVNFSPRNLSSKTITENSYSRDDKGQSFYSRLYNSSWIGRNISTRLGINICKATKIKGYTLSFSDVRTFLQEDSNNSYNRMCDIIHEFYYCGERNCLLGFSSTTGLLYIRGQTLSKVMEHNDDVIVQRCLKNLLTCYYQVFKKFSNINIREYKENIAELIEENALNRLVQSNTYSYRYYERLLNIDKDQISYQQFTEKIKEYIKDMIDESTKGLIFGVKEEYSYSRLISDIMTQKKNVEKQVYHDGFIKGMKIGLKIEMLGWRSTHPNFADESQAGEWWEKEVNIKPSTFIYQEKRYLIPEAHRKFHISKLYVNQNGQMRCVGSHPNVSSSHVCMGDLKIDFTNELTDIQDSLSRAEELLDMINYDSSYRKEQLDDLMKVSTEIQVGNELDRKEIKSSRSIRELGSSNDRDEDGEEEIIEKHEVIKVKSNNGISEIQKFKIPKEIQKLMKQEETTSDNVYLKSIETAELPPVYMEEDLSVAADLHVVSSDGTRRPVVFIGGPSGNNVQNIQVDSVNGVTEEFALGDKDLL